MIISQQKSLIDDLISVVVILKRAYDLSAFDETVFSLSLQDSCQLEIITVCDSSIDAQLILEIVQGQTWIEPVRSKLVRVDSTHHSFRHYVAEGIKEARGRYLNCVESGDVLHFDAFSSLMTELKTRGRDGVFGPVYVKYGIDTDGCFHVQGRDTGMFDLNRLPVMQSQSLASCLIDRSRVSDTLWIEDTETGGSPADLLRALAMTEKLLAISGSMLTERRNVKDGLQQMPDKNSFVVTSESDLRLWMQTFSQQLEEQLSGEFQAQLQSEREESRRKEQKLRWQLEQSASTIHHLHALIDTKPFRLAHLLSRLLHTLRPVRK